MKLGDGGLSIKRKAEAGHHGDLGSGLLSALVSCVKDPVCLSWARQGQTWDPPIGGEGSSEA